jgi:hypothetical protein
VICEPTRTKWWGTGRRSPRVEDWLQIPLRGKWHVDSGAVGVGEGTRAARRAVCQGSRDGSSRKKKINLIIAVARAGEGQQIPRPSPMVPSWHTKKEKGRFGVGAGLRGQIPDRSPIFRRPGGPSKAPLAYRPTSSLPNPPGQVKKEKEKGRFGVGAELRGQVLDRPPILRGSVGPSKAPLADRPTSSLPNPPGQVKKKEKGRFGVGAELRGQILDRPPIRRGSVGPSKAPLAYRPTSSLPNPPG